LKKAWLISFNVVTLLAWTLFLLHTGQNGFQFDSQGMMILAVAQGLAIFEVINSIFRLAGANWMLTTMQVSSRFLVVGLLWWMPLELVAELGVYSGFLMITIAWSITEITRVAFYISGLFGKEIKALLWMRYTFFIVLYPIGVIGEFMAMFSFMEWRHFNFDAIGIGLVVIALLYVVFFPKLYMHMFGQRRKNSIKLLPRADSGYR
jgi:very-long-chain (3R)-3-hydroxyacyl-CoA dehydratase